MISYTWDSAGGLMSDRVASFRELTLSIIQPRDYIRVLLKEIWLGLDNGIVLGFFLVLSLASAAMANQ